MRGYIVIPRNIRLTQLWGNPQYFYWWIDLIMMANYEESETLVGTKKVTIKRGQILTTLSRLAGRWGSPRTSVHRYLSYLADEGYISKSASGNSTIITINNYNQYQLGGAKEHPETTPESCPCETVLEQGWNKDGTKMEQFLEHPFGTLSENNMEHQNFPLTPCYTMIYGVLEEEGVEHLNKVPLEHPFGIQFETMFGTNLEQTWNRDGIPPTPLLREKINKKINKINNKKNNSSTSIAENAHAGASVGVGACAPDTCTSEGMTPNRITLNQKNGIGVQETDIMSLINEQQWSELVRMKYKITLENLSDYLKKFYQDLLIRGKNETQFICDLKSHFDSWLRIKLKEEKTEAYDELCRKQREELQQQRLDNERRKSVEYNRRREAEIASVDESTRVRKVSRSDQW